ncbi:MULTISPECIES: 3'(2'),5'-bisphosphate nucleotidase CysQ [unclassified Novosphingobium]|uniref:3'(2'),5'-bisphosphate nucleotidase CysQ n=1 Tax=unclassified Novosphingobium TaxID=2644732 RepID=UPI00146BFA5A|nr:MULTISPECIES: 3'(2'),5'-bisphosphate nucleotidase CysQ [unclassified Novosphingobium]NMN06637.1 3'(2'), 5'-bisphosphate nucleotidase [Novosphingobium sp. SG919]NMN88912.1 3'(2'), 5'-bisphosphate nucleotidase [Novosphingobium sp. SG916]
MDDLALARHLAAGAGRILMDLRAAGTHEGKALGAQGDVLANAFLMAEVAAHRPDDGVLSEETADTPARLAKDRVWIIDPLDGTREYGEGRSDWAVHVGLAVDGKAVLGAVALPGEDLVLDSAGIAPLPPMAPTPRLLVSRSRPAHEAVEVAKAIGGELLPMGSAGAKAMAVVRGQAEIYLHSGGQYEWDNCAPVAVAAGAGLHVSRIDGSPLVYNNRNTWLPDLLICRREWSERVLEEVARIGD